VAAPACFHNENGRVAPLALRRNILRQGGQYPAQAFVFRHYNAREGAKDPAFYL
jgi:hypothetical protein